MKLFKLTIRNILANGLKTWLTVFVLSIAFMLIIFMQGMMQGWDRQAIYDTIKWEIAGGQYWSAAYDPYDPFTLDSAAALIPSELQSADKKGLLEPILIAIGTIFPSGRSMSVLIKGISPGQQLLALPATLLESQPDSEVIPAIIGTGMARQSGLKKGDEVILRWRDANGTFEAQDIQITGIFKTFVSSVDNGQIWISIESLQKMLLKPGNATIMIKSKNIKAEQIDGWAFKGEEELTQSLREMLQTKKVGQSIFYIIFLLLGLLAVFDTQTLGVFRRQREIGTFIALGMTKKEVVHLFTIEGAINAVLAILLGAIYGIPVCLYYAINGIPMPSGSSDFGITIPDKIYPFFSLNLIMVSIVFMIIITALVSYLPARKIARMNPADAIKGKVQ